MVAVLPSGGASGLSGWAVFRLAGGAWQLVLERDGGGQIAAAGSDIRETVFILRPGEPRCCPTGGTKARLWHWNGTHFAAGAWKQVAPATPRVLHVRYFKSPSGNLTCALGDSSLAYCRSWSPPHSVTMYGGGRIAICTGSRECTGPCGPRGGPSCSPGTRTVLAYGQQNELAGVRCRSVIAGITCTEIRSGKGFLINRDGIKRVGS